MGAYGSRPRKPLPTCQPLFYSCSPTRKAPNLNAISPQTHTEEAERRQRHLSVCQEIIDLGMKLTRAAAQRALDAAEEEAQPHARPASTTAEAPNPNHRPRDPNLTFSRLSRGVLQAVTLEAQIAAGAFNRAAVPRLAASTGTAEQDARVQQLCAVVNRGLVTQGLHRLTETHPDRWSLGEAIEDAVDDSLAGYPDDPLSAHFTRACQALDLTATLEGFPDYLVEALRSETPASNWPTPDG